VLSLADLTEPAVLPLASDADRRILDLEAALEPHLAEDADLGHIADWAAKLNGAIARLAGLLHLAQQLRTGWQTPIEAAAVDAAAALGDYFLAHALAVFDTMHTDPVLDGARTILDWITRTGVQRFTRRQLFTGISRAASAKPPTSTNPSPCSNSTATSAEAQTLNPPAAAPPRRPTTSTRGYFRPIDPILLRP